MGSGGRELQLLEHGGITVGFSIEQDVVWTQRMELGKQFVLRLSSEVLHGNGEMQHYCR